MIFQIPLVRFIFVFIIHGIVVFTFALFALLILKKNRERIFILFSLSLFSAIIAGVINFIYAFLFDEKIVLLLHFISISISILSPIFLLSAHLTILYSEEVFDINKQLFVFISYLIAVLCMMIFLPFGGIIINESTNWRPIYNLPFLLYIIGLLTIGAVIPIFYTSFKIYKRIQDDLLRKRWKIYNIGLGGLFSYMYGAFVTNYIIDPLLELIFGIYALSIIFWLSMVYYGMIRQLEEV